MDGVGKQYVAPMKPLECDSADADPIRRLARPDVIMI